MNDLLISYSNNELEINKLDEQISLAIADLQGKQQELKNKNDLIKEQIKKTMEAEGSQKFENDFISITYVAPTTRITVDSKLLKEKYIDIYNECSKTSEVKSSVRIKVKGIPKIEDKQIEKEQLPF